MAGLRLLVEAQKELIDTYKRAVILQQHIIQELEDELRWMKGEPRETSSCFGGDVCGCRECRSGSSSFDFPAP